MSNKHIIGIFCSVIVCIVSVILLITDSSKTDSETFVTQTYNTTAPIKSVNMSVSATHNPYLDTSAYFDSTKDIAVSVAQYSQVKPGADPVRGADVVLVGSNPWKMVNITYPEDGDAMNFEDEQGLLVNDGSSADQTITTLNYGAESIINKLTQSGKIYQQYWQCLTVTGDKMLNQDFQTFWYASFTYNSFYSNSTLVYASTSFTGSTMNAADYSIVYNDPQFGMHSGKALSIWQNAYLNGANSDATKAINEYFASLSTITGKVDAWQIIGSPTGPMATQTNVFQQMLVDAKLFTSISDITADKLAIMQWMNPENVSNNAAIKALSANFTQYTSMYQMEKSSMEFGVFPEVYFYMANGAGGELGLTLNQSLALFNMTNDFSNNATLMHPKNMYDLVFAYKLGIPLGYSNQESIIDRFGLNSTQTTAFIDGYLDKMCVADGPFQDYGNAFLEKKSLSYSYEQIQKHLPLELATRNTAQQNLVKNQTCEYYWNQVIPNSLATSLCKGYNFTNPASLQLFVNGTWYNQEQAVAFQIGVSTAQITSFYDVTNVNSFGSMIANVTKGTAEWFNCESNLNCTSVELASLQWGSAYVTQNPGLNKVANTNTDYLPKTNTMANWGSYKVPGMDKAPEFNFYSSEDYANLTAAQNMHLTLNSTQVMAIMDTQGAYFGLNNIYNINQFIYRVTGGGFDLYGYLGRVATRWQLETTYFESFQKVMQYHTSEWLMDGVLQTYAAQDLAQGFNTIIASKINTGSVLNGNIYVDSEITPILNSVKGPMSGNQVTVLTGQAKSNQLGDYTSINGWNRAFFFNKLFIGTTGSANPWQSVPWFDMSTPSYSILNFDGATPIFNNMQGGSWATTTKLDLNTRRPYVLTPSSDPVEECVSKFTNGTCVEHRNFTTGSSQYVDETGLGFAYELPYDFTVNMTVVKDDGTGYFIQDNYRQTRSIKIPTDSFCWPMVTQKATLFTKLNWYETSTQINAVYYNRDAYVSTQHEITETREVSTPHPAIKWIFGILAIVSFIATIVLICQMRSQQNSIDVHNREANRITQGEITSGLVLTGDAGDATVADYA